MKPADTRNKEEVYDQEIAPLVTQIIDICRARGIAMLASFAIPTPADPHLCCTTMLPDGTGKNGPGHMRASTILGAQDHAVIAVTAMRRES